jgi:hypothetical protein
MALVALEYSTPTTLIVDTESGRVVAVDVHIGFATRSIARARAAIGSPLDEAEAAAAQHIADDTAWPPATVR